MAAAPPRTSKWRDVLALLPSRSTRPLNRQSAAAPPSCPSSSSPAFPYSHPAIAHINTADALANEPLAALIASPLPTETARNLDYLLHNFSKGTHSEDIQGRVRTLNALCTLCADRGSVADECVAAGGVDIILNILTNQTGHGLPPPAVIVEESEKALFLLHLITTSSKDGCAAALRQSSLMISVLGKKLLRISEACTASAIAVLSTLCYHSDAAHFRKALSETAIPSKLVVVLQVASEEATKQRAGRLLRIITNI